MFLIKTVNSSFLLKNRIKESRAKFSLESLSYIKLFKKLRTLDSLQFNNNITNVLENSINYILNIHFSNSNTLVNLSNIKGRSSIFLSSGSINLKKKQKRKQPAAIINLIKNLIFNNSFLHNKTIALHFRNVKPYYESLLANILKKFSFLKVFKSLNLHPHNGCRPKKIKKFKRRTKRRT